MPDTATYQVWPISARNVMSWTAWCFVIFKIYEPLDFFSALKAALRYM